MVSPVEPFASWLLMTGSEPSELKSHLLAQYDVLLARLSRRLGSADLARDVLQDAYVKLASADQPRDIRHPTSYLMRMALNLAANVRRRDRRLLSFEEVTGLLDIPDDGADAERMLQNRFALVVVKRVMSAMSKRRFDICASAWIEGVSTVDLAERHGLAVRTVQHELRLAAQEVQAALAEPKVTPLRKTDGGVS